MPLSWNEIKANAIAFSKEWENESSEHAEAKPFWEQFFSIFGVTRRRIAQYEASVQKLGNKKGFIDLFWPGTLIIEHKSKGKDLDNAFSQAIDYFAGLKEHDLPKFILVSDFQRFRLYDLESDTKHEFPLKQLVDHIHLFGFIAGYQKRVYKEEDPVNIEAAERMGKLHDRLEEIGYTGHALEVYLVRLLFCLFAEDTGIFERTQFQDFVDNHTREDGSDLAERLAMLFQILNTPPEKRLKNLDETLSAFPYVNGKLFEEMLPMAAFDRKMREILLYCCALDWSKISPAIFGSMFQAAMNPKERRNLGAHYTSEKNIQKVIKPLFLDELYSEFEKAKSGGGSKRVNDLKTLHQKLASLHFLDPACGCGNFLIIAYRELRTLELLILRELYRDGQGFLDVRELIRVDVDQFAGIEYDEFPARIAEVAMWLLDHQMNLKVSEEFGQYFVRLPLQKAAKIVHGNALQIDWEAVVPKEKLSYILGNPPFIGAKMMNESQRSDLLVNNPGLDGAGLLDYVAAWYLKAADLTKDTFIKSAFVSTNSITQGEQVGILWSTMIAKGIKIHFAHRTFKWNNEARGVAAVHCIIVGFASFDIKNKLIFDYQDARGEPSQIIAQNINPYLVDAANLVIVRRSKPLCHVPEIGIGNKPIDGGHYLFTGEEKDTFIQKEPQSAPYFRRWIGADEFINGWERWCLWLGECSPELIRKMPESMKRVQAVREYRLSSVSAPTRKLAESPTRFHVENIPNQNYLIIPEVSSERRKYIPIGYENPETFASNKLRLLPSASHYLFGNLTSEMHMTWMRYVCGRLKSDYSYSIHIVYNNYPFPLNPTDAQKKKVEEAAQAVLDTRAKYPGASLADLYDPNTMPPDLVKAHQALDKAVDLCYRPQPFSSELSRIEFLFGLYEQLTAPMFGAESGKKRKK
ncbi:MAG: class I SAM-dependent DNA methyltransferase [Chitinophagales bacterium]|nr:class I SAM-dependent DNA methyltransferase [Chitinophagales bacterium]